MKNLRSVNNLIEYFAKLPGVGHRSAEKLAYSILEMSNEDVSGFSKALSEVKNKVHKCPICGAYTEEEICEICSNPERKTQQILVVSQAKEIESFEKLHSYLGTYHVLGDTLSAVNGVGIDDLNIKSLLKRIDDNNVEEAIIATNPTLDGETTALYLAKLLEDKNVKVTRLAYGLPMGGHLEYADALTLARSLENRKKI